MNFVNVVFILLSTSALGSAQPKMHPAEDSESFRIVENQYIVVLHNSANLGQTRRALSERSSFAADREFVLTKRGNALFKGFLVKDASSDSAKKIARDPRVRSVIQDVEVKPSSLSWGLDRIDQHSLPLDDHFIPEGFGNDAHIYVVDSGILTTHEDFNGRAIFDADFTGQGYVDDTGHGTKCAGIAGGRRYGVAKGARLHAVKVTPGSLSTVFYGLIWTAYNAQFPAVILMPLITGYQPVFNTLVNDIDSFFNIPVIVSAGNGGYNACPFPTPVLSPASADRAFTVASSDAYDVRDLFSNYGSCVDIFAPGSNITTTFIGSDTATAVVYGTSYAVAHVAGVAAIIRDREPGLTPEQVRSTLSTTSTNSIIAWAFSSNNHLLYTSPYP
ncbi:extracellular serine proteinase-like isoform X2 [Anneissia japonica]|nr:extracellular serine proteinase-like isoform X2 [Anneissia japonica]